MGTLATTYHINETNLAARRAFVGLKKADIDVLRKLAPWARGIAKKLAREFYDSQFAFGPTVLFFESQARRLAVSMSTLREKLEAAQAGYFQQIFDEAAGAGEFGVEYFEKRLYVGKLHNKIDLPLKWYAGSYVLYMDLTKKFLKKSFRFRPGLRAFAFHLKCHPKG